ncbi:hypothetical protein DOJK_01821 [Patescibacteria group bacterium]|nr:hypothetical protein DOJK_01821 [Patescibacteria group bacterium]
MLLIISLFFSYVAYKILFFFAYQNYTDVILFESRKDFLFYIISPILLIKQKKDKYFSLYFYLGLGIALLWGILIAIKLNEYLDILAINFVVGLVYLSSLVIFILFLLYLSLFDLISFSIPEITTKRMILFCLIINLAFLILRVLLENTETSYVFGLIPLGTLSNLIAGLVGGLIIWLIVRLTKQRGMGDGDVDILASIGLMLGVPAVFYSFFYTLMAASAISIVYVIIIRRYKNVLIPFVPFLATGYILTLVLQDYFVKLFQLY